ncbi:hypothetical protein L226DRAFT_596757 [Lentinus tigrinus ALCF2SS1-7]|uniref:Uncharacterized protein n=1 Tax=Lentinus tigrinus ALCF2SS1-6 TaxID=1328759 RepID=A0A5C2RV63_9APHY|nr:hypothetical protein L227DRAFT_604036 [Lentinus tigrinus ALCF2SS1-6]RPD69348.1 hypothetical protein L226DRAFT_596757 [Lentinus tigrinus ALCF2SS1-7]
MLAVMRLVALAVLVLSFLSVVTEVSVSALLAGPLMQSGSHAVSGLPALEGFTKALAPAMVSTREDAARAVPSGSPGTGHGVIKLVASDSSHGYLTSSGITVDLASADTYSYNIPSSSDALVGFTDVTNTLYRLAAFASTKVHLGTGHGTAAYLENFVSVSTPAGSKPVSAEGYGFVGGYGETTIFSVDSTTGKITVQWVNSDGSVVYPSIYRSGSTLLLTCALAAYTSSTTSWTPVTLYFSTVAS